MVLHVLAVGQIGGVAGELRRDLAEGAQRGRGQRTAVAADPQHEELVFEHVGVLIAGPAAVVSWLALGVQTPPAETATQVAFVDALEAVLRVDVLDAGADVERVVVPLGLLVRVERLAIAECPLALALGTLHGLDWLGSGHTVWLLLVGADFRIARCHRRGCSSGADPAAS